MRNYAWIVTWVVKLHSCLDKLVAGRGVVACGSLEESLPSLSFVSMALLKKIQSLELWEAECIIIVSSGLNVKNHKKVPALSQQAVPSAQRMLRRRVCCPPLSLPYWIPAQSLELCDFEVRPQVPRLAVYLRTCSLMTVRNSFTGKTPILIFCTSLV